VKDQARRASASIQYRWLSRWMQRMRLRLSHAISNSSQCLATLYHRSLDTSLAELQDMFDMLLWDAGNVMHGAVIRGHMWNLVGLNVLPHLGTSVCLSFISFLCRQPTMAGIVANSSTIVGSTPSSTQLNCVYNRGQAKKVVCHILSPLSTIHFPLLRHSPRRDRHN